MLSITYSLKHNLLALDNLSNVFLHFFLEVTSHVAGIFHHLHPLGDGRHSASVTLRKDSSLPEWNWG